jgi:hypothetical protein
MLMSSNNNDSFMDVAIAEIGQGGRISRDTLPFVSCSDARRHGFKKNFLRVLGYTVAELRMAGFTAPQIAVSFILSDTPNIRIIN